jgi:pimeloyl-ACP methyl ester carboxylesterase
MEDNQLGPISRSVIAQAADTDDRFVRWAASAVVRWRENPQPIPCPVVHIHGRLDRVLPLVFAQPTKVLEDAGHVVTLSHPAEVNAFISEVFRTYHAPSDDAPANKPSAQQQ